MVRSILLRGFDQQMANLIGDHMKIQGIKFVKDCVPVLLEKVSENIFNMLTFKNTTTIMFKNPFSFPAVCRWSNSCERQVQRRDAVQRRVRHGRLRNRTRRGNGQTWT